ncbi:hypothetical protein BLAHAN_07112 [Blautia hansenii DSM 20583]|uniref:Uncharacterized protein n=1 Tax=Blautia hansenii DSM 20583 TaxID=537007 RepID=C9LCF4_BLAHA|nr:hypothetical protein BLAHAN_07112 [Blautia hansenii DSM 20583]
MNRVLFVERSGELCIKDISIFLCVFRKYKNGWITPTVFVLYLQKLHI